MNKSLYPFMLKYLFKIKRSTVNGDTNLTKKRRVTGFMLIKFLNLLNKYIFYICPHKL